MSLTLVSTSPYVTSDVVFTVSNGKLCIRPLDSSRQVVDFPHKSSMVAHNVDFERASRKLFITRRGSPRQSHEWEEWAEKLLLLQMHLTTEHLNQGEVWDVLCHRQKANTPPVADTLWIYEQFVAGADFVP